ncbi:ABC transporter permease [Kitasatospora sp. NPDC087315]|uniref:ABC transporter permease n=1 Tax=Kitasatospora sp. NPDC087315 TaxID=3364069 RepID=UPI003805D67F
MLGFVVRRLRGRLSLAAAVLVTMLITTAVLTALVAFNSTVGEAGLRQALQGAGRNRANVLVTSEHGLDGRAKDDEAIGVYGGRLFGDFPVHTESLTRSRSYGLPSNGTPRPADTAGTPSGTGGQPDLTLFANLDHEHVRLVAGSWPAAGQGNVQTAVPQTALARLGLTADALPAEVRLDDRFGGPPLTVRVTGVYRATDTADPYWGLDPLGGREIQAGGFTTYGPLLVDDSAFTAAGVVQDGRSWLLSPDLAGISASEAAALRDRATLLADQYKGTTGLQIKSELPTLLTELESSALVARSTLMIGALQLSVLAAAVLLLVVHLMATRQESENALLAARGASSVRLSVFTATESLLLALPAALLAPLFAPLLLRALASYGPLARVPLDTGVSPALWPLAAACALACVLLTITPTLLRGAGRAVLRRAGRRQTAVTNAVRSGADLALLVLAGLAYQQLSQYSGGLSTDASGRLGLDPVLIAAPTLALCAGTLLVLRLLPFAARLGSRLAARGRGLAPALVGWQLARRPGRATGPVLLLVLSVSTGVLALGQHSTWSASQHDQASFATAGGLRISASETAPMGQGGRYGSLPGGDRLIPVTREERRLPDGSTGHLLALDAAGFADRVPVRSDLLGGKSRQEVFAPLAQPAPTGPQAGLPLPGHPLRIEADINISPSKPSDEHPQLWALIRDRFGSTYRIMLSGVPADGDAKVTADLTALTDAPLGSAAAPLTLSGVVVGFDAQYGGALHGKLTVRRIAVADTAPGPATVVPVPADLTWSASAFVQDGPPLSAVLPTETGGQQLFKLEYVPGSLSARSQRVTVVPAGAPAPVEVPGVATHAYLAAVGSAVGETIRVPLGSADLPVKITAAVEALPVAGTTALAVDLATAGRFLAAGGKELPGPTEWWLPATGPDDRTPGEAAAVLRTTPGAQNLQLRDEVADDLLSDPLSAAPQSALAAIALVTAVLASIGYAAASAASARERSGEFAVLLAIGTPRRWLRRTAAAEQALLVGLGSVVGLGLGALIVQLIVPLVVLTPAARRPVPEVLVDLPFGWAVLLAGAITAVPLLSAFVSGRRRRDVAARLRHVEEM